jgi:hypothetical protein
MLLQIQQQRSRGFTHLEDGLLCAGTGHVLALSCTTFHLLLLFSHYSLYLLRTAEAVVLSVLAIRVPNREAFAMPSLALAFHHQKLQHLVAAKQWSPADLTLQNAA